MQHYIIVDTNILVYCAKNRVDIMREIKTLRESYKPAVIPAIESEARRISREIPEGGLLAAMIDSIELLPGEGRGDDAIVEIAARVNAAVITNDRELRTRLKSAGVRVFSLRNGRRIEAE